MEHHVVVIDEYAEHHVIWHCGDLASSEYATLRDQDTGHRLQGIAVLPLGDVPCHIEYEVVADATWSPHSAIATIRTPGRVRTIHLERDRHGDWTFDGLKAIDLAECSDVDLGWTPSTNTVPIRRLDLAVGKSATISAAWVRFPELDVVVSRQQYTRLAVDRWRYRSAEYDFELITQVESGLVLAYGDTLWRTVATATLPHHRLVGE